MIHKLKLLLSLLLFLLTCFCFANNNIAELSHNEKKAIEYYSSFAYKHIHNQLRNTFLNRNLEEDSFHISGQGAIKKETKVLIQTLNNALDKLPKEKQILYRGFSANTYPQHFNFLKGSFFINKSYFSTTKKEEIAKKYGKMIMVINSFSGRNISKYSSSPGEEEILFSPNTVFKVTRIKKEKEFTYIYLKESTLKSLSDHEKRKLKQLITKDREYLFNNHYKDKKALFVSHKSKSLQLKKEFQKIDISKIELNLNYLKFLIEFYNK